MIADWTHYQQLRPTLWEPSDNVADWWLMMGTRAGVPRSGLRSLILLVVWELWKERNARTFERREQSATTLLLKIKEGGGSSQLRPYYSRSKRKPELGAWQGRSNFFHCLVGPEPSHIFVYNFCFLFTNLYSLR